MPATPTATALKVRYPEFTWVADPVIDAVVGEAMALVDDDWVESDQQPAILALTAHYLSMEGYPQRATSDPTAPLPASAGRELLMRRVGDVSVQYAQTGTVMDNAGLMPSLKLTPYGRRFAHLLRMNVPTITVL